MLAGSGSGYVAAMDHSRAPIVEALADYHAIGRLQTGLRAGMVLPDPADRSLHTIKVVALP
jgi:hypothetical protein